MLDRSVFGMGSVKREDLMRDDGNLVRLMAAA